ncbi:hypothetical protein [Rhizobium sp. RU36D]|uniref:hypothetical protein n=1 Tax=Rhizobium sp. RU36D TaxID=1907415 RepID=UPI0009D87DB1|nr:hypothetical protein [Rhizobium sp. RU36D]SMD18483.1 hypothetical protein SAMN05880593_13515 [Rhizobium sp. RU36D]
MVTVKLSREYRVGDVTFDAVELREPTYKDAFMDGIGRPEEWQPAGKGSVMRISYPDVIDKYLQKLITSPGYEKIGQISAADAVRLERAVCDFFREPVE